MKEATLQETTTPDLRRIPTHLCVVIPMFDSQDHIKYIISELPSYIKSIIVVDDCSQDTSYERAKASGDPRVNLIRHTQNLGVGGAMLSGYTKAMELGAEIIIKIDSDGQMDPAYLPHIIGPIMVGETDYAKGNRFLHARELQKMPTIRRIGNIGLSIFTKLASGYWNIFDPTNGFTAIHTSLLHLINIENIDRRYFFETSMLLELGLINAVVMDVPIPAKYSGETSQLSEWKSFFEFPPRLFKGFFYRLWIQYVLRDFGLFSVFLISGLLLLMFGLSFGIFHWIRSLQLDIATPTGTVMLAVLPIILGTQFILQAIFLDVQNIPTKPLHRKTSINTESLFEHN